VRFQRTSPYQPVISIIGAPLSFAYAPCLLALDLDDPGSGLLGFGQGKRQHLVLEDRPPQILTKFYEILHPHFTFICYTTYDVLT